MHFQSIIGARALALGLAVAAAGPVAAQSRVVLPAGTVVIVRTVGPLESSTAKSNQVFETTVEEAVGVDEYTAIPAGSRIRGVVTLATPASRQQSGVIEVVFDRLILSDGSSTVINGVLTSTDSSERRQIKSNPNARVVFVGQRGGIGAAIAGAGSSKSQNSILGALGSMLSEGRDVSVPAGTLLAVELREAVTMRGRGRMRADNGQTIYTAPERIRAAQLALSRMNYYRGATDGRLDDATRRALFSFQVDKGLSGTGNLDGRTAQALGIDLGAGLGGAVLSVIDASNVRRDAQSLIARERADLAFSSSGRLDANRAYAQGDVELLFALSAFADNASMYEMIVRNGANADAAVLAGRSLMAATRRVDAALQNARATSAVQNSWAALRRQLQPIDVP